MLLKHSVDVGGFINVRDEGDVLSLSLLTSKRNHSFPCKSARCLAAPLLGRRGPGAASEQAVSKCSFTVSAPSLEESRHGCAPTGS